MVMMILTVTVTLMVTVTVTVRVPMTVTVTVGNDGDEVMMVVVKTTLFYFVNPLQIAPVFAATGHIMGVKCNHNHHGVEHTERDVFSQEQ